MVHSKEKSFKSLIHSNEGIHFTAYLKNSGSIKSFKKQIRKSLINAKYHLSKILSEAEIKQFVSPIRQLLIDDRLLKSFSSNIGLFRTENSFRVLNVPIDVEPMSVVATSFHIKPLLRWIQADKEFLFLELNQAMAQIFMGSQSYFKKIGQVDLSNYEFEVSNFKNVKSLKSKIKENKKLDGVVEYLNECLFELTKKNKVPLFVAVRNKSEARALLDRIKYPRLRNKQIFEMSKKVKTKEVVDEIRNILKEETKDFLERSIIDYYWAENINLGNKNIFDIAKAAVSGKIKKLIVADGIQIFGKMDKLTGELIIHPAHLDHEDDDLLDDLAQTVLTSGGKVVVVPKDNIPKGRSILAIMNKKDRGPNLEVQAFGLEELSQKPA